MDGEVLFYSALPRLEIEGREEPETAALLTAMEMTEGPGGLSSLELRFTNVAQEEGGPNAFAFEAADSPLSLGKAIRLVAGEAVDPQEVFTGTITGIEFLADGASPAELIVLAEDALQAARLARRSKVHPAGTLDQLIQAVAGESGLRIVSAGFTQALGAEVQLNETDLGFLRRVLARHDADLQMVGEELHVSPRANVDRGAITLRLGETLTKVRVLADLAHQVTGVSMAGWDPEAAAGFKVEADQGAHLGPGSGQTGLQVLPGAIRERVEHLGAISVTNQAEAQALVNAVAGARARRFVTVEATATGDPRLRVGTTVELEEVGPRFSNTYTITEACHRFDQATGYVTEFRAEGAHLGPAAR